MNAKNAKSAKKVPVKKAKAVATSRETLEEAYDEFPYESYVYPQSHPERMYTIAKLFGLNPPDINKARILELGCGIGGNLTPIALLYPKTKCLGIDLSGEQVEQAESDRKAMGLKNVEFRQMDITKIGKDLGEFDYIICHGVFSWVPDKVRKAIFEVCHRNLSKDGLAIISFNTLPGWASIKSLREMMLFHTKNFKTPAQQIHEAKQLLNFLYENTPSNNEAYRQIIDRERKILSTTNDSYIFHEHLELENHQFYLHEFTTMALKHDLMYVGDAEISSMHIGNYSENARKTLGEIKDIVRQEQYIDFLCNRRFRHTIVTHTANASKISRSLDINRIMDFYVQARFKSDPTPQKDGTAKFVSPANPAASFTVRDKNSILVFKALEAKNRPVKIEEFAIELEKKQKIDRRTTTNVFLASGFTLILQNFLTLHEQAPAFVSEVSKKPKAFSWAMHQVKVGGPNLKTVTSIKREAVTLTPFVKAMLPYLDGKHTTDMLADEMTRHVLKGDLKMHKGNQPVTNEKEIRTLIKPQIGPVLESIARQALLEA